MRLSILIPSYKRPEQLAHTLSRLVGQCREHQVRIRILDNASPYRVSDLVESRFAAFADLIDVVRNAVNIGAEANVCRCYELAESEWFWMLGDDDNPSLDSIGTILSEIDKVDNCCGFICFSTSKCRFTKNQLLRGGEDFWLFVNRHDALNNMSFISSGVYRTSSAQSFLIEAYRAAHTSFPHLVLIRKIGQAGHELLLSSQLVCEWQMADEGQHWCRSTVMAGIPALRRLDGFGRKSKKSLTKLFEACRPRPFQKWAIEGSLGSEGKSAEYWMDLFCSLLSVTRGRYFLICLLGALLCCTFVIFPSFREAVGRKYREIR